MPADCDRLMFAPFVLAAFVAAGPAPSPTPALKTIVTVKVSTFCNQVRKLGVPIAFVTTRNDQAFDAINRSMLDFLKANRGLSAVSQAEVSSLDNEYDDSATYNAHNSVSMNRLSQIVWQINENLSREDGVMADSWKEVPAGKDVQVDAMRRQLQNLIDLQRSLAANYTSLAEMYFDNEGSAQFHVDQQTGDTGDVVAFKSALRNIIFGEAAAMARSREGIASTGYVEPDVTDTAKGGTMKDVVQQLALQEMAFKPQLLKAGDACGI